ncbi:MAG: VOC family protein [bacterium]
MKLRKLTPMLYTNDLQESVAFYTEHFGFQCEALSEESGWASVKRDNVAIMFAHPNANEPFEKPIFTGTLYFYPDDVDEIWERLKDKVKVCYAIENFDFGMR